LSPAETGVTVVLPVYNGARTLADALTAILAQEIDGSIEVLVVDDRSSDGSVAIARRFTQDPRVRLVQGEGRGAAAAINAGVQRASYGVIAQIDQDMIPRRGWLACLLTRLRARDALAAVQGRFEVDPSDGVWARVAALDLAQRYAALDDEDVDHVCTGSTLYRREALQRVGLFDESLGYGYDNDMSYRLVAAGWQLAHCSAAVSVHRAPGGWRSYAAGQYGVGYGRLDLVHKHPRRWSGDRVSGLNMIGHAAAMLATTVSLTAAAVLAALGTVSADIPAALAYGALGGVGAMAGERWVAGLKAWRRFDDVAGFLFAPAHLLRDLCWAAAIARWLARRAVRRNVAPTHSMRRTVP
jgi:hypothetical protein